MEYSSETEQKIIKAATEVFLQKGKEGARMQEIAGRAGINKALLHYYFRSKEKLYNQVFTKEVSQVFEDFFESIPLEKRMEDFLHTFVFNYIDHILKHPQVVRFMLWELESGAENLKEIFRGIYTSRQERTPLTIIQRIETAIQDGEIRPLDSLQLLISIIGVCVYAFVAKPLLEALFPGVNVTDPAFAEKRKKEVFNLIWNGIKS
ncbi:MAG: TetR/AcrR family transcriptional regulator [Calditrichia bacterium]